MNEQKINDLKNALREIVQMISARNEPLSQDLKALLAQVMEHVATRIQELRQEEEQGAPPITPPLDSGPFPSSNINSFKYNPETQDLFVKFQDKYPATNGPIYRYSNIPSFIYDIFRRGAVAPKTSGGNQWHRFKRGITPSLGASLSALVKNGNYPYQRVN